MGRLLRPPIRSAGVLGAGRIGDEDIAATERRRPRMLLRQLAQQSPHPTMRAVVERRRLGEHQDAFAVHHADAVLLAEADGGR